MNRFVFCFCLVALSALQLLGQVPEINVVRTPMHVSFPGTSTSMIPPSPSFVLSDKGIGFVNEKAQVGISINEIPMPFDSVWNLFGKDVPTKEEGLEYMRDLKMNGNTVKLVKAQHTRKGLLAEKNEAPQVLFMMFYGNDKVCFNVFAGYPVSKEKEFGKAIEMSLMSFLYESDKPSNPLDMLAFSVDIDKTPLTFYSTVFQTGAMYGSKEACETQKQYCDMTFSTMMMPFEVKKKEQKENTIKRVQKPFGNEVEIKSVNGVTFGGLKGYEVVGHEKDENGKVILKAVVILYDKDRYFELSGKALDNFEGSLVVFRKVFESFKLK